MAVEPLPTSTPKIQSIAFTDTATYTRATTRSIVTSISNSLSQTFHRTHTQTSTCSKFLPFVIKTHKTEELLMVPVGQSGEC